MSDLEKLLSIKAMFQNDFKEYVLEDGSKILLNDLALGGTGKINKGNVDEVLPSGIYKLVGSIQISIGAEGKIVGINIDGHKIKSNQMADKIQHFLNTCEKGSFRSAF